MATRSQVWSNDRVQLSSRSVTSAPPGQGREISRVKWHHALVTACGTRRVRLWSDSRTWMMRDW